MASLYDYLGQKHKHSNNWEFSGRNTVRVTEVSATNNAGRDACTYLSRDLDPQGLHTHLEALSSSATQEKSSPARSLHAVWIPRLVQPQKLDVSEELFEHIHDALEHNMARNASDTALAGVSAIPHDSEISDTGFVSFHPKFSLTWSVPLEQPGQTTMICVAEESKRLALEDLLQQAFIQRLCGSHALPALLASILFSIEIGGTQETVKQSVRQVEVRTGHHDWKSRAEAPALGDLTGLAAKMSGCSTRIESCLRKQHATDDILLWISEQCNASIQGSRCAAVPEQVKEIQAITRTLQDRARAQLIDTEFVKARVRTQLDALYQLVAQNDALSAQEMAQDCRLLAAASLRDSTSMRCIAVVTMFFLPGTFVSSLLSIPLFDWDADTSSLMYRRSHWRPVTIAFVAITLPFMALTFGVWALWMLWNGVKERKRSALAKAQLGQQLTDDEVRLITSKRHSLSEHLRNSISN